MNYKEARVYLRKLESRYGSVLGLENMIELLHRLADPQKYLKFVHIAGTNGKGSVLAYISEILNSAGYRTGRYISPTLFSYRERIQVDGENIGREEFARLATQVIEAAEAMRSPDNPGATAFEIETAIAFLYFRERACDIVVLETGLGGRDDATNVIKSSEVCVLTSIGKDHCHLLGNNLERIAKVKAGIIKRRSRVISAKQHEAVASVIEKEAVKQSSGLSFVDLSELKDIRISERGSFFSYRNRKNLKISMIGRFQVENAALALDVTDFLISQGYEIGEDDIISGLGINWPGRLQKIGSNPTTFIDGAHNVEAAKALARSIEKLCTGRKIYYIIGIFKDKDYDGILKETAMLADGIWTVPLPNKKRGLNPKKLAAAASKFINRVKPTDSLEEAVEELCKIADKNSVIVFFGSLSFLGKVEEIWNARQTWIEKK